jgi:hypothetical protein
MIVIVAFNGWRWCAALVVLGDSLRGVSCSAWVCGSIMVLLDSVVELEHSPTGYVVGRGRNFVVFCHTFPDLHLTLRYALNAVNSGSTSVGIKASNGVVIATEKKLPALMEENAFEKVAMLTKDIGVVYSGNVMGLGCGLIELIFCFVKEWAQMQKCC